MAGERREFLGAMGGGLPGADLFGSDDGAATATLEPEVSEDAAYEYEQEPLVEELENAVTSAQTVDWLNGLLQSYKENAVRKRQEKIWDACEAAYMGYAPKSAPLGVSYTIREIFREIETLNPQMLTQFFGGEKFFRYAPRDEAFDDAATAATEVVHDQINRFDAVPELRKFIKSGIRMGTGIICWEWRKYRHFVMRISDISSDETEAWDREQLEVEQGAPALKALNPRCVYVHPNVENIRQQPAVFVELRVSVSDLKTMVREGWLDPARTEAACKEGTDAASPKEPQLSSDVHETAWCETDGVLSERGDEGHTLVVAFLSNGMEYAILDGEHLLRGQLCPYGQIPMAAVRNYPQDEQFYGIPEPLLILEDQKLLNDFMALYVMSVHWGYTPMWAMTQNVAKAWRTAEWKPGGRVVVGSPPELDQLKNLNLEMRPTAPDLMAQAPFLKGNMKLATGITDEMAGAGSSQRTATGVVRMQEAAGIRMQDKVREWMPELQVIYRALYMLNAMYLEGDYAVRVGGDAAEQAFKRYSPDVFDSDIDVEVELGNVMETTPEMANNWRTLAPFCLNNPLIDQTQFMKKLLKAHGVQKPERLLASSMSAQQDALKENQMLSRFGYMPEPKAGDDHAQHLQIHQMFMQTPEFQQIALTKPVWAAMFQSHVAIHAAIAQQMQAAAAQAAQASQQAGAGQDAPGPTEVPAANAQTEEQFDNAAAGAAQQGVTV